MNRNSTPELCQNRNDYKMNITKRLGAITPLQAYVFATALAMIVSGLQGLLV